MAGEIIFANLCFNLFGAWRIRGIVGLTADGKLNIAKCRQIQKIVKIVRIQLTN